MGKLTDAQLRTLKTPGKHFDGGGLYLELTPAGGRYWRLKYRFGGKENRLALGVYPATTLAKARKRAADARELLAEGQDPATEKKAAKTRQTFNAANTFKAVALDWAQHQQGRRTERTDQRIWASFELDVFPVIGGLPIANVTAQQVMGIAKRIELRGAGNQAARALERIKAVFRWAVVHERLAANPLIDLKPAEVLKPRTTKHRPALPMREMAGFLRKLEAYDGDIHTRHALHFLVLTATRPGEVRGATWAEIDLDAAMWTIPAERMKMREAHQVPLSSQALQVLRAMQPLSGEGELVFPSPFYPRKPLSENTFNSALASMGFKGVATAHGFRAVFSTAANEAEWDADVIERQLAHRERNEVRAAYHRATYSEKRRELLQWWADKLDGLTQGGKVIPIRAA